MTPGVLRWQRISLGLYAGSMALIVAGAVVLMTVAVLWFAGLLALSGAATFVAAGVARQKSEQIERAAAATGFGTRPARRPYTDPWEGPATPGIRPLDPEREQP